MLHSRNAKGRFAFRAIVVLALLATLGACGRNVQVAATSGDVAVWASPTEAEVALVDPWGRSVEPLAEDAGADGALHFRAGGGVFNLVAEAEGYARLDEAFDIPEGGAMEFELALQSVQDDASALSSSNLTVRSSVSGMEVEVTGEGEVHRLVVVDGTGEDGAVAEARFRAEPGAYQVTARAQGHEVFATSVAVEEGAPVDVEAVLPPDDEEPDDEQDPEGKAPGSGDEEPDGGDDGSGGEGGEVPEDGEGGSGEEDDLPERGLSLRGDPSFRRSDLTSTQRDWYDRVWAGIRNPDALKSPDHMALSDDLYEYGRYLHTHLQSLLLLFRVTGDLALLDEVDRLTQLMYEQLDDSWRDTLDGTDGTADGYLNWVFRYGDYEEYEGKDIHETNEIKTHAIVASVAYALHVNRDLTSPSGRDYAGNADAWREYLLEHFEPKWRKRSGMSSGFPYVFRPHTHTYLSQIKYYYYLNRLTGDGGYLEEAEREADVMWNAEFRPVSTGYGDGYVWARSVLSEGGSGDYLHPTTYARYAYLDFIEFHFEGFDRWADVENLRRFANTFADYVIDVGNASGDDWFAGDIGGDHSRAGISSDGWDRMNLASYSLSGYALIAPWDRSGEVADVTVDALAELGELNQPRTVHLAAGMFLHSYLPDDAR